MRVGRTLLTRTGAIESCTVHGCSERHRSDNMVWHSRSAAGGCFLIPLLGLLWAYLPTAVCWLDVCESIPVQSILAESHVAQMQTLTSTAAK